MQRDYYKELAQCIRDNIEEKNTEIERKFRELNPKTDLSRSTIQRIIRRTKDSERIRPLKDKDFDDMLSIMRNDTLSKAQKIILIQNIIDNI